MHSIFYGTSGKSSIEVFYNPQKIVVPTASFILFLADPQISIYPYF